MNKNKVKEKIEAWYKDCYGGLIDELIRKNSSNLEQEALRCLVEKNKQRLNKLSVVCLNADSSDPLLMYSLGDNNIFLEYHCSGRSGRFYVRNGFFKVPLVREINENERDVFKDSVLKYLTENEEGRKITIESKCEKDWVFKCQYSVVAVESRKTLYEVVRADDFEEATEKVLRKLDSSAAVEFFDFELWGTKGFAKLSVVQKACKNIPFLAASIKRSAIQSTNEFSFVIPLDQ